ncbi:MAG TPA: hypothetical protein VHI52_00635, partial [Verrucomicrobiae bacterium]|nr:hypothetical protein [Verrucomicrobiae bacterium]
MRTSRSQPLRLAQGLWSGGCSALRLNHARYDATGELAAEYETVAQSADCTTCYLTTDPLGSTRVITDGNGNVVSRHDYYPFGEELATSNRTSALQYGVTDYVAQR